VLKDLPIIGALFGVRDLTVRRTELIVMITPRVIRDRATAAEVTNELRRKLPLLNERLPTKTR
jgi:general secretion pathway protein D